MDFESVWAFTEKVPGFYSREEAEALYRLAGAVPDNALCVEIGVQFGRSASVMLQVAKWKPLRLVFIDPWVGDDGFRARMTFLAMADSLQVPRAWTMVDLRSEDTARMMEGPIHLLHVDGDHEPKGIEADCRLWLPKVAPGGFAAFHDYERRVPGGTAQIFPGIKQTVDAACAGWEPLAITDSLGAWRKPIE